LAQSERYVLFSLLLLSVSLVGCSGKNIEGVQIGEQARDFSLPDQTGKVHSLAGNKGSVVLIRFWADWCPNCKEEMPRIDGVYRSLKDKGFRVLGVNVKQGESAVSDFVKEYNISFPTPMDKDATVAKTYGVVGLPTTFIVDKDGNIREKVMGDMTREDVERLVKPLL
jgi:peroxiredoxin